MIQPRLLISSVQRLRFWQKYHCFLVLLWAIQVIVMACKIQPLLPYMGLAFSLSTLLTMLAVVRLVYAKYGVLAPFATDQVTRPSIQLFYLLVFVGNLFVYSFIQREQFVYFWDFAGYWAMTLDFTNLLQQDFISGVKQLHDSILHAEYSSVPGVALALPFKFVGYQFDSYVLSIYNTFLVPFYLAFLVLIIKVMHDLHLYSRKLILFVSVIVFAFPALLSPMLTGYLDSIGLIFVAVLLAIAYHEQFSRFDWKRNLFLIAWVVVFSFTRRWYGFWIAGFFGAYFLTMTARLLLDKTYTKKDFMFFLLNMCTIGVGAVAVLNFGFHDFFMRSVFNNYGDAYTAYRSGTFGENVKRFAQFYGYLPTLLGLIGAGAGLRWNKTRYFTLFVILQLIIMFAAFIRVNDIGVHHYYLFDATVLYLLVLGCLFLVHAVKKRVYQWSVSALLLAIVLTNFVQTYHQSDNTVLQTVKPVLSTYNSHPRVRHDLPQLHNLALYLNEKTQATNKHVYVVASSSIFNDDIMRKLNMPEQTNAIPALLATNHVDRRDGFPQQFLTADYVVVADPPQFHLRAEDQQVIGVLAKALTQEPVLSSHYRLLQDFRLDAGVIAKVYEKTTLLDRSSIEWLRETFQKLYPDHPNLNSINNVQARMTEIKAGDQFGYVQPVGPDRINLHPGRSTPTSFVLDLNKQYQKLSLTAQINPDILDKIKGNEKAGEVYIKIEQDGQQISHNYVNASSPTNITLDVQTAAKLRIEVNTGKYGSDSDWLTLNAIKLN